MNWTKHVVTHPAAASDAPNRGLTTWNPPKALGAAVSAEAMVKLLSADNLTLLHIIGTKRPDSMRALALLAHPKESNLSQTLKKLRDV